MAHKQLYGVCYEDCPDTSHYEGESGHFISNSTNQVIRGMLTADSLNKPFYEVFGSPAMSLADLKRLKGIPMDEQGGYYYSDTPDGTADKLIAEQTKTSFNIGDGLQIAFPLENFQEEEPTNQKPVSVVGTNLIEVSNINNVLENYKTKVKIEFDKFNTSLKVTDTKQQIKQTNAMNSLFKATENQAKATANLVSEQKKANEIQEKIANKETIFKNTANITNNFDNEFATTLGTTIGNELKSVIEQQNQTLNTIKDLIQTQNKYYENKTTKSVQHDGKTYTPQEIENLKNLENLKGLEDENSTDLGEMLGLVEDFMDDGFTLDFNPFKFVLDELKKGLVEESEELKIKYNIKGDK